MAEIRSHFAQVQNPTHVSPPTKLKIYELKNPRISFKKARFLYRRTVTPGAPDLAQIVADGSLML